MSDIRLQEIVTRAVVGRGDRRVVWSHTSPADGAENVLGVHIGDTGLSVVEEDGAAAVRLTAVIDLWLGFGDETRVRRLTSTHSEPAAVQVVARVVGETETRGELLRSLRCVKADISDGQIVLTLETDVALETTGLARFWIKTYDLEDELGTCTGSDSYSESSSSDSTSDFEQSATSGYEVAESEGDSGGLDESASLAGHPALPEPLLPPQEVRRSPAVSHFQSPASKTRVVIQGH